MPRGDTSKAWSVLVLSAVLAACLLAALPASTGPAEAASRFKTVTRTFQNSGFVTIWGDGAANPYPSEINAGGFRRGRILDANLTLKNFGHVVPSDVDVMLSHGGVDRTVMSDVGSGPASNITLRLDDEAAAPLRDDAQLASGTFRPTNVGTSDPFAFPAPIPGGAAELSGFDRSNPNGPWQLWIVDDTGGIGGEIRDGWSITIKARVPR